MLRVGATESPPWITRSGSGATGPEAELIEEFAGALGSRVEWRWGPLEDQMEALEHFERDLVAAGLTRRSPWAGRVGLTRPWTRSDSVERVLAVPPGENAMLLAVDRFLEGRRRTDPRR